MTNFSNIIGDGRNYLDNSAFEINQRTLPITSAGYVSDRWIVGSSGSVGWSSNVSAAIPVDHNRVSHYISITTAKSTYTGTDHLHFKQHIEGYNFLPFVGRTGTVSFWVYSSVAGIYCFYAKNPTDRSYVTEYTIDNASTWEHKKITIPFNYSGGTWNYTNGTGIQIGWTLATGSTYVTGTSDEWVTGSYFGTSNQTVATGTIGNIFYIASPKFELGSIATPYVQPHFNPEFRKCMRYFENRYRVGNATSTAAGNGNFYFWLPWQVRKREAPTVSVPNGRLYDPYNGWFAATATSDYTSNIEGARFHFQDTARATYTAGVGLTDGTFIIDAELY